MSKRIKTTATLFVVLFSLSSLFAQYGADKYGSKGAPKTEIPKSWTTADDSRSEDYILALFDSWGDGWDGASLDLYVNGTLIGDDLEPPADIATYYFTVADGDFVETVYTAGAYESEHSYGFYDHFGTLVASDGPSPGPGISFTVDNTNMLVNGSFEHHTLQGNGWQYHADNWETYPDGDHYNVEMDGSTVYNSDAIFNTYDGTAAAKMWGNGSENNLYETYWGTLSPGTEFDVSAMFWQHPDDNMDAGSFVVVMAKYFTGGWGFLGMDSSTYFRSIDGDETWTERSVSCAVPDGAEIVQVGIMYTGTGGGVYIDDVYMEPIEATDNDNVTIVCDGGSWQSEVYWEIQDSGGELVATGGAPYSGSAELQDGEYTVYGYDSYGDGWNGNYLTITDEAGNVLLDFTLETGSEGMATFSYPYQEPVDLVDVYFSEYAEGSSNNKYLEVYNGTGADISLSDYVILGNYNGNPFSEAFTFAAGATLAEGDVYVIANSSASDAILALADEALAYGDPWYTAAFNGDDVRALAHVSGTDTTILDIIGTLDGDGDGVEGEGAEDDPGGGFDVAGVSEATKDHTLVRQESQIEGNGGDWAISAGTDEFNSEWSVEERPTADYTPSTLGWHINEPADPCEDTELTINMYDSYGDGWNGNILMIGDLSYTIESGDFGSELACLMDGSYSVTCDGGAYQGEVSWEIIETSTGTLLLAGGAPFSGVLQIGETSDVLGCTDPNALNYNEEATVDDGSCYYAGDSCNIAIDFVDAGGTTDGAMSVYGATEYAYDADWYYFVLDEAWDYLRISLVGSDFDTKLEVWDECDDASWVAYNDDFEGLQSEVLMPNVTAGDGYVKVYGYGSSFGNYVLTIEAYNNPVTPTNLTAEGSLELVSLAWDPYVPTGRSGSMIARGDIPSNIADVDAAYSEKKEEYIANHPELIGSPRFQAFINEDNASNSRSTDVIITCDGGSWQSEVSWEIHDAGGTVVAAGGAPFTGEASLDDGVYSVYGYDSYGDGWNGNYLTVSGTDGTVYLNWTVEGSEGETAFAIGDDAPAPDLSLTDIWYDHEADAVMVNVANTGDLAAGGFYVVFFLTVELNDQCAVAGYEAFAWVEGISAGESVDTGVGPGLLAYIGGYGDYTFGAFADFLCQVAESDETNNTIEQAITIEDPNQGTVWNVYRSDGGAGFSQIGTAETDPTYADPFPGTDGLTEYCYYVTQVMDEGTESGSSNEACATPIAPMELPTPTDLVGEADGWQVNLYWTAPDLSNFNPGMAQQFESSDKEDDPSTYINYDPSDYPDMTRQGGDTDADAMVVDGLPYNDMGTTEGYTDDYDEACPYTGSTSPDVVYSFTSDVDLIMSVDLCSDLNFYDTKTYVYENSMGNLAGTVSLGANTACNDDFCANANTNWASFIGDVIVTAGNTYYIVIDGYGGGSGDYDLTLADATPSPVLSYNVYRDGVVVGNSDGANNTDWSEFVAEMGTYDYSVTAVYETYGESGPSNTASVEVTGEAPSCNAPQNLMATVDNNDVSLMWEAPEGTAGSVITYYNGNFNGGVGTNGAAVFESAVIFTPEQLQSYDGMSLTTVSFIPNEADAVYTVMIYDVSSGTPVAVDSSGAHSGADLVIGEFNDVDLANPITIDWTQNLSFGYKCVTNAGYPLGIDDGPATPGYSDLLNFGGWVSMADTYGLNYNWAIAGLVNAENGRSLASMDPIDYNYPRRQMGELSAQRLPVPIPIEISTPTTRDLIEYNVYRDGTQIAATADLEYSDMDVSYGVYTYFVTALYDDSEDCGESDPSNEVEVEVADTGDMFTITIDLYDSYGDGWNGGNLNVAGSDYTIEAGDYAQFFMDLAEGTHSWYYTPGSWPEENSWMGSADGNILFEGVGPDEQGGTFTLGAGPEITAIYDIQYSTDAENDYPSPLIGQEVSIVGVVTAVKYNGINVQDAYGEWNGIWVYSGTGSTDYINIGDLYQINGTVDEYNLLTELVCGEEDLTYLGSDYYVDPVFLESTNSANNEALEGVYVNVSGECIDDDVSDYGQWAIDDGTGPVQVEDHYVSYQPTLGYNYDLLGPMGHSSYDTTYEIGPSDSASIVETPPCEGTQVEIVCDYGSWQSEVSWFLIDNGTADTILAGGAPDYQDACMYDGSYTLEMYDSYGDGWNGNMWEIWVADSLVFSATLESGSYGQVSFVFGDTEDILGCTDPEAQNYNPDATLDDGSCYYAGDSCFISLDAIVGLNPATGADQWFSYTATMSGSILATTCYEGQCEDTRVEVYNACPEDGGYIIAESDDAMCMDATGCTNYASEVEFECVAGETYYFFWDDFWGPGAYEWLLDESPPPSSPQDLIATADLELITLAWEGLDPGGRSNSGPLAELNSNIVDDYNQTLDKKDEYNENRTTIRSTSLDKVYSYAQLTGRNNASRDASVIMTLYDTYGDGYDGTGYITDTSGTTVYAEFPGGWTGYESAYGPYDLADGLYMVWFEEANWAYETTWELTDASDSTIVIASGSVESPGYFAIGEGAPEPDLSLTEIWYDHDEDAVMVNVANTGEFDAGGFYVVYFLTVETSDECGAAGYEAFSWVDGLPAGGTLETGVGPGTLDFLGGYGDYTFGAFADFLCQVAESDETNNTIEQAITISDPNEGIVWNVYRSDGGAEFAQVGTAETDPTYTDPFPGTDGLTEYCYYVTQIMGDEMESDTSNHACASPIAPVDLPIPTDLVGEADGWQVNLSWTPPDLSDFDPGMAQPFEGGDKEDDPSMYINYDPSEYPDMTRQGGDTDADATVVDGLPYNDTGTTVGYTDDYDEVCPYSGSTSPDVVYSFTSDVDLIMSVDLCSDGNFYDTKTYVYENEMGILAGTVSLGANTACNDDFCANANTNWASWIGDVIVTAGNTYYIVIDGYGGDAGDYDLLLDEVAPPSPLLSYNVYRDDVVVGNADGDAAEWTEFITEVGTYDYFVTAVYETYGESDPSNTVSVEVEGAAPTCNAPQNLTAEALGNDVSLMWEAPAGGSGWLHHDNGESTNSIGTGAVAEFSVAARFGPEHLMDYNGMSLTQVQFVHAVAEASYQVVVWTAEVDGAPSVIAETDWIPGTDLPANEWNVVDLAEAITIDWSQEMWFGYNINTPSGYPAGCDSGPMVPGYGAKILWGGEWYDLTDLNAALDYNWSIQGFVDESTGRSIASMGTIDSPAMGQYPDAEFNAQRFPEPIEAPTSLSRSLVEFRVYRNGEQLAITESNATGYDDVDAPWGSHTYFVTAFYDDSEDCGESDPSNEVEVYLENSAPLGFSLISPPDGFEVFVNEDNQDEDIAFIWTASADPDNDPVQYFLIAEGAVGEDTVEHWYPENELGNPGFEDGSNENANYPVGWELYPDNQNHLVFETGWEMWDNTEYTFEAFEGDHSLLIWGLYNGEQGNENNVFQTWYDGSLEPGTEFSVEAWMMTDQYNSLSQGDNYAVLFAKYFGAGWSWIGMETSAAFDGTYSDNDWHNFHFNATVPDGAEIVQVGVMIVQANDNSHGTVYVDEFWMHMPMTQTGLFVPYGQMAEDALEDTVSTVVYLWDVWAWDGWDGTPSNDGPRTLTVDVSALLGIDGNGFTPDIYALHNNYPNPFNPITNITYDIPEVSDVTLEIFNVAGQKVRTLVQKTHEPGRYRIVWSATNDYGQALSSGMYFYRIKAGDFVSVKKLILMK